MLENKTEIGAFVLKSIVALLMTSTHVGYLQLSTAYSLAVNQHAPGMHRMATRLLRLLHRTNQGSIT